MAGLTMRLNRKTVEVASIRDAQIAVREHIEANDLGGTAFHRKNPIRGVPVFDGRTCIGRISYNGRFWPANMPKDCFHPAPPFGAQPREITMSKSSKKSKKAAPEKPAAETVAEPVVVTTASKKAAKAPKAEKKGRERKTPEEPLCVFALRLTTAERDQIHGAAGPAKASRFARAILVAASRGDEAAVVDILKAVRGANQ